MTFPTIKNISDVLPFIEGRKEFIVVVKPDGYTYIDYVYVDNDSFDDLIRLECRGLIFDTDTGNILRRPFEKFFNFGEKGTYDTVDWSIPHIVMDKRDGSMIAPFILNGAVRLGTRAGITEHSLKAEERHLSYGFAEINRLLLNRGLTPIYEWTSPDNRIVLPYEDEELRVLAIREMETGNYLDWKQVENFAKNAGIKTVDKFDMQLSPDSIFKFRELKEGVEGYVVFFPSVGLHIKIKTEEYSKMHRAVSFLDRENMILPVVLDGLHDDILPALSNENQKRVIEYAASVNKEVNDLSSKIETDVHSLMKITTIRKDQAIWIQNNIDKKLMSVYFHSLDGKSTIESLKFIILKFPELLKTRWK